MSRAASPGARSRSAASRWSGRRTSPAKVAPATTVLYARNLFNFVQLLVDPKSGELKIDTADELVKGTLLTTGRRRSSTTPSSPRAA